MAATTVSIITPERAGSTILVPVAAATKILQGTIVCRNSSGYAVPGADTASLVTLGVAADEIDNTGSAGDLSVPVKRGVFKFPYTGLTIANIGTANAAVILDNQTVTNAATAANDIAVGKPLQIDSDGIWVEIL